MRKLLIEWILLIAALLVAASSVGATPITLTGGAIDFTTSDPPLTVSFSGPEFSLSSLGSYAEVDPDFSARIYFGFSLPGLDHVVYDGFLYGAAGSLDIVMRSALTFTLTGGVIGWEPLAGGWFQSWELTGSGFLQTTEDGFSYVISEPTAEDISAPEPGTLALLLMGLAVKPLMVRGRRM